MKSKRAAAPAKPKTAKGRPPFVPTEEQRKYVKLLLLAGVLHTEIGKAVGVSPNTFAKAFRDEIDRATLDIGAHLMDAGLYLALGRKSKDPEKRKNNLYDVEPNGDMLKFMLRSRFNFRDRSPLGEMPGGAASQAEAIKSTARRIRDALDDIDKTYQPKKKPSDDGDN